MKSPDETTEATTNKHETCLHISTFHASPISIVCVTDVIYLSRLVTSAKQRPDSQTRTQSLFKCFWGREKIGD